MITKLCIVGWGRAGKDVAGVALSRYTTLRYGGSTSWAALPMVAKFLDVHPQIAWSERSSNRDVWYRLCNAYRHEDPTRLIRKVLEQGDMVCGVRDREEFFAGKEKKLWDYSLWIDRPGIMPDPTVTFSASDCDEIFVNNFHTVERYELAVQAWARKHGIELRKEDILPISVVPYPDFSEEPPWKWAAPIPDLDYRSSWEKVYLKNS